MQFTARVLPLFVWFLFEDRWRQILAIKIRLGAVNFSGKMLTWQVSRLMIKVVYIPIDEANRKAEYIQYLTEST